MKDITQLLHEAGQGDRSAADQVVAQLYGDLQRLARQRIRQAGEMTLLDTTALVHEAWLRLAGAQGQTFPDRRHFLAYAARTMRHVVIDLVRARQADRRGGAQPDLTLNTAVVEG